MTAGSGGCAIPRYGRRLVERSFEPPNMISIGIIVGGSHCDPLFILGVPRHQAPPLRPHRPRGRAPHQPSFYGIMAFASSPTRVGDRLAKQAHAGAYAAARR